MRIGSLFSGVGGIDLAFENAGAQVIFNCEIDVKCRNVLANHWPGIPRFKDVKTVTGQGLQAAQLVPDALVGGFPCTDVSVAGRRAGLAGEQSGLFFEFARLLDEVRPAWALIENVPGLLSSHGGADMGTVVGNMVDIGYGVAWRVLDAQYFGVAQRRRRVFIVGCLGDRARAAEVLLEPEGGGGDPPARRTAGEDVARGAGGCIAGDGELVTGLTGGFGNGGPDDNKAQAGWLVPAVSNALCSNRGQMAVRRLTPLECLRLQGFPDDWLDRLKLADSVKYRMAGNAVAVPCVEWIARRMLKIDEQP